MCFYVVAEDLCTFKNRNVEIFCFINHNHSMFVFVPDTCLSYLNSVCAIEPKEILESFLFCMYLGSFTSPYLSTKLNVQLNGKILQVLKDSLIEPKFA
jgi:hypothetical protein